MALYVFTNVGRGNVFRQARAFLVAKSIAPFYGRRGWAEIGESDGKINEPYRLRLAFPKLRWTTVRMETHTPVTFPKKQEFHDKAVFAANGYSGGWPRKFWTVVKFPEDRVMLINGHMPPGAFNAKKDERYEKERGIEWRRMWDTLKDLVSAGVDDKWNVVVMMDANRQGTFPLLHEREKLVKVHTTDRIYAVPCVGKRTAVKKVGSRKTYVDFHESIYADMSFVDSK